MTSTGYNVRQSTPADADDLFRVWKAAVLATHHFLTPGDIEEIGRQVREDYLPHQDLIVAANRDGRPLGFLGGSGSHIDALFVDPGHHGRGIGTLLLEHYAANQSSPLTLEVNEQNPSALHFYQSRGFKITGRSPLDHQGRPFPLLYLTR